MWITFIGVYTFLSVIPQELIYRSFYFNRYQKLINNKHLLLFMNAIVFSLGHIFFMSPLVLGITFVGGWVFAYTYTNTKSLLLVSIEHAIYGCWLYTVGFGELLGFPVP
ncbi:CPBP family intramembrane glutamic endopeptidase [Flavicella marina]|uniref:CPBP family intramembrane glutamic endopeptidase n=1 Tax=Flavicella marina TaxID=1475951 RepID=UPI00186ACBFD|nr:CPBP family intramembrane glutamic endopeptidase [Flavicella marina]